MPSIAVETINNIDIKAKSICRRDLFDGNRYPTSDIWCIDRLAVLHYNSLT